MVTKHTILPLIEGCRSMRQLKQLQGLMIITALIGDVVPLSRLMDFCADAETGDMSYARSIFLQIDRPTTYIWNSMIRGLSGSDQPEAALSMYRDMLYSGLSPDNFTYPFALKACARISDHRSGRCIHGRATKTGYEADVYVFSSLIHMHASSGDMDLARRLFEKATNRNVVSWTTMIAGYVDNAQPTEAIRMFRVMELEGVVPNEITMVHVLVACAQSRDLETGRWVHRRLHQLGIDPTRSNVVLASALLDMYARCGSLKTAREMFEKMPQRNEVSWNTMIGAYNQYGRSNEVFQLFKEMCTAGMRPDKVTLLGLLGACAENGAMVLGQGIHAYVEKTGGGKDVAISTSLMDMYAKTGDAQRAFQIFGSLEERDVLAWTSMIICLAMHGHGMEAVDVFREMQQEGVAPDHITFIGVLTACSHAGMVDEGYKYFESMRSDYGIRPMMEHYGCVVDLLSRAGRLEEAERLVKLMPYQPSVMIWGSILSGCEIHGNVDLAERIGNQIMEFDPQGSGIYALISNIYAGAGRWEGVEKARRLMWQKRLRKTHGSSSVEVNISCLEINHK
ncbi:putative pentatricopeptide repeat-containing protein At3g05240 [Phoenix dactylifera]|uniref:Pentatricopeptide repeat-containing protein At3g05240 n=1 Tax=Phoenix dactylifera TaxID=42345 RepID=A0A8B7CLY5_PHODC|nr:putative pentatricopeptide repeat-containing protein At3g05240 [Phoenix dactylifera]